MIEEFFGKRISIVRTVFLYKVNVAVAAFVVFLNAQFLFSALVIMEYLHWFLFIRIGFMIFSLIYGIFAFNSYSQKIIIYEHGIEIKGLFRQMRLRNSAIAEVDFFRTPMGKNFVKLSIIGESKPLHISLNRYEKSDLLVACFKTIRF